MKFGNIEGFVRGTESVVFDYEVTDAAVSSITTGAILNGDVDEYYTIILHAIADTTATIMYGNFNADTTAGNYGQRSIVASDGTIGDASGTSGLPVFGYPMSAGRTAFCMAKISAKSGAVRLLNLNCIRSVTGSTMGDVIFGSYVWNNTADNLTTFTLTTDGDKFDIGTRLIILKGNNFTDGTPTGAITTPYIQGSWLRVGTHTSGSDETTFTIDGLDGDRDVLYRVRWAYFGASLTDGVRIRMNTDSGSNYGRQSLFATSTTLGGARSAQTNFKTSYAAAASLYYTGELYIFAKSGFLRPAFSFHGGGMSETTVSDITSYAGCWSNTSDNITQMVFSTPDANYIKQGSQFDVYALRPEG